MPDKNTSSKPKKRIRKKLPPGVVFDKRLKHIFFAFSALFLIIAIRAFTLHIIPPSSKNLYNLAKRQYSSKLGLTEQRGSILDRRDQPLAISITTSSIFINPRIFDPTRQQIKKISNMLSVPIKKIDRLSKKKSYFAWLKRKIPPALADKIKKMRIKGLYDVPEPSRFYPSGNTSAHLVGFVGTDNSGLMGLERDFDQELRPEKINYSTSRDGRGKPIFRSSKTASPQERGKNIHLTIDKAIQEITANALIKGVKAADAKGGFAIVSDPHTGKILALANAPTFNPNGGKLHTIEKTKNRALTDTFEPGSVVKPLVVAQALEKKLLSISSPINCEDGHLQADSFSIRDSHKLENPNVTTVITESSNIGIYKIAQKLGQQGLYKTYKDFGLATQVSGYPKRSKGRLTSWSNWRPVRFANISFGQGFTVSGLEMVVAYSAIANGGRIMEPLLVDRVVSHDGTILKSYPSRLIKKKLSHDTARKMRDILKETVENGTGQNAKLELYTTAGKTGTSEKVDPETRRYSKTSRIASFIGFAPVNDPYIVVYVVVDEPGKKPYYGGKWAAPIFSEIVERSLKYLNVAPDRTTINESMDITKKPSDHRRKAM